MQEVGGSGSVLLLSHDICACCSAWAVRDCVGLCVAVHGNAAGVGSPNEIKMTLLRKFFFNIILNLHSSIPSQIAYPSLPYIL